MSATQELKNTIQTKLENSGEYDRCVAHSPGLVRKQRKSRKFIFFPVCRPNPACRLKEHLRQKLIESGWRDNLKEYTMGALRCHLLRGLL